MKAQPVKFEPHSDAISCCERVDVLSDRKYSILALAYFFIFANCFIEPIVHLSNKLSSYATSAHVCS